MKIIPTRKKDLALLYNPQLDSHSATNMLNKWIQEDKNCWRELQETGYRKRQKIFTRDQVEIIVNWLGNPSPEPKNYGLPIIIKR